MEPLKLEFRKNTFDYKQEFRDDSYAIYRQSDNGNFVAFEVFRIKKLKEHKIYERLYPASEQMPGQEEWGTIAFTCHNLESCHEKIEIMKNSMISYSTSHISPNFNDLPISEVNVPEMELEATI